MAPRSCSWVFAWVFPRAAREQRGRRGPDDGAPRGCPPLRLPAQAAAALRWAPAPALPDAAPRAPSSQGPGSARGGCRGASKLGALSPRVVKWGPPGERDSSPGTRQSYHFRPHPQELSLVEDPFLEQRGLANAPGGCFPAGARAGPDRTLRSLPDGSRRWAPPVGAGPAGLCPRALA